MTPVNEDRVSVTAGHAASGNVFRTRLNQLFAAADPNLTNAAVVRGLVEHGCRISKPYLSQLRRGHRASPSDEVVTALADFFGVSRGYFFTALSRAGMFTSRTPRSSADLTTRRTKPYCWRRMVFLRRRWTCWRIWPPNSVSPMAAR
ncbi:helix-turn-helix transcriptional regulator [Rhodococcus qingshengii]|uniref:Helix-turn-helix transcriptional regulator n=1 Tax=Rhodococcus qingshengii TaxID=334542 RepID=A0AAW6LZV2_RHOSG|nr:helix-turn-helix transcriptional regulator [Rhodococcus qingshengii]MDE8649700.1 helix-turn-helix transcriptional regulator [Rhodococcus qingshengii]